MFFYSNRLVSLACYTFISMFVFVGSVFTTYAQAQDEMGQEDQQVTWSVSLVVV